MAPTAAESERSRGGGRPGVSPSIASLPGGRGRVRRTLSGSIDPPPPKTKRPTPSERLPPPPSGQRPPRPRPHCPPLGPGAASEGAAPGGGYWSAGARQSPHRPRYLGCISSQHRLITRGDARRGWGGAGPGQVSGTGGRPATYRWGSTTLADSANKCRPNVVPRPTTRGNGTTTLLSNTERRHKMDRKNSPPPFEDGA